MLLTLTFLFTPFFATLPLEEENFQALPLARHDTTCLEKHLFDPHNPGDPTLDQMALKSGTDKSTVHHSYTEIYTKYFAPMRNCPLTFLEIGIYKGDSVQMWEAYFPSANLHFIDIKSDWIEYFSDRSHYHFINQSDISKLQEFAKEIEEGFDIIIDDGGHRMSQQINSFKALFPFVKPGGLYIIEDLATSYDRKYNGIPWNLIAKGGARTAIGFLTNLVHHLNYVAAKTHCSDSNKATDSLQKSLNTYQKDIFAIHFYSGLCVIIKK